MNLYESNDVPVEKHIFLTQLIHEHLLYDQVDDTDNSNLLREKSLEPVSNLHTITRHLYTLIIIITIMKYNVNNLKNIWNTSLKITAHASLHVNP